MVQKGHKKRASNSSSPASGWRKKAYVVIFEADTKAGKLFDELLLIVIIFSVLVVLLESVEDYRALYGKEFLIIEWIFTFIFSIEYLIRTIIVRRPMAYIFSFWGLIDLLAVIPTYASIFIVESHFLMVIRAVRLLRVFRILKLGKYINEADHLMAALKASRHRISVFIGSVLTLVLIFGTLMYVVEGPQNGYTSIPRSMYWAVITLTTVGFGDIVPQTALGQAISSIIVVTGYSIIAIPTGMVSAEFAVQKQKNKDLCPCCYLKDHDSDANYCKRCGKNLRSEKKD